MAKLDKTQQKYAMDRVESMVRKAVDALKPEKQSRADLISALEKAGFVVTNDPYYFSDIKLKPTAKQAKSLSDMEARKKELRILAEEAKDQIMLGDSTEVTNLLAELAKKLTA